VLGERGEHQLPVHRISQHYKADGCHSHGGGCNCLFDCGADGVRKVCVEPSDLETRSKEERQ